jgi:hypothetical protein
MQEIYYSVPETYHDCKVYSTSAVLYLQFVLLVISISHGKCVVLLLQYFLKYVLSALYDCFLYFLDLMFSWCVAQVFPE